MANKIPAGTVKTAGVYYSSVRGWRPTQNPSAVVVYIDPGTGKTTGEVSVPPGTKVISTSKEANAPTKVIRTVQTDVAAKNIELEKEQRIEATKKAQEATKLIKEVEAAKQQKILVADVETAKFIEGTKYLQDIAIKQAQAQAKKQAVQEEIFVATAARLNVPLYKSPERIRKESQALQNLQTKPYYASLYAKPEPKKYEPTALGGLKKAYDILEAKAEEPAAKIRKALFTENPETYLTQKGKKSVFVREGVRAASDILQAPFKKPVKTAALIAAGYGTGALVSGVSASLATSPFTISPFIPKVIQASYLAGVTKRIIEKPRAASSIFGGEILPFIAGAGIYAASIEPKVVSISAQRTQRVIKGDVTADISKTRAVIKTKTGVYDVKGKSADIIRSVVDKSIIRSGQDIQIKDKAGSITKIGISRAGIEKSTPAGSESFIIGKIIENKKVIGRMGEIIKSRPGSGDTTIFTGKLYDLTPQLESKFVQAYYGYSQKVAEFDTGITKAQTIVSFAKSKAMNMPIEIRQIPDQSMQGIGTAGVRAKLAQPKQTPIFDAELIKQVSIQKIQQAESAFTMKQSIISGAGVAVSSPEIVTESQRITSPMLQGEDIQARTKINFAPIIEEKPATDLIIIPAVSAREIQQIKPVIEQRIIPKVLPKLQQVPESKQETKVVPKIIPALKIAPEIIHKPELRRPVQIEMRQIELFEQFSRDKNVVLNKPRMRSAKYSLLVRRKGVFGRAGEFETKQSAFTAGVKRLKATAAASFKVVEESGKTINFGSFSLSPEFRSSKKDFGVIVQKREFRIKTPGEKQEITRKGLFKLKMRRSVL